MERILKVFILLVATLSLVCCGTNKSQAYYDYETECIGTELDGSLTLRSWGRARNAADAYVQAQKQAVYDVIFTGITKKKSTCMCDTKPLLLEVNAKEKYEEYFNKFFADGGAYTKYASMKEKHVMTSNYSKTDAQHLCQTTVCVFRDKLKQRLIEDKILKK